MRGGAWRPIRSHTPEEAGSIPALATSQVDSGVSLSAPISLGDGRFFVCVADEARAAALRLRRESGLSGAPPASRGRGEMASR